MCCFPSPALRAQNSPTARRQARQVIAASRTSSRDQSRAIGMPQIPSGDSDEQEWKPKRDAKVAGTAIGPDPEPPNPRPTTGLSICPVPVPSWSPRCFPELDDVRAWRPRGMHIDRDLTRVRPHVQVRDVGEAKVPSSARHVDDNQKTGEERPRPLHHSAAADLHAGPPFPHSGHAAPPPPAGGRGRRATSWEQREGRRGCRGGPRPSGRPFSARTQRRSISAAKPNQRRMQAAIRVRR